MAINQVSLTGNLTREPELKETESGFCVLKMGIAVNERTKDKNDEWKDYPNYFDLTMFGARAKAVAQYLHKGLKVSVAGSLRYSSWDDENGSKRSKVEVIVKDIEFMAKKQEAEENDTTFEDLDGDVPF